MGEAGRQRLAQQSLLPGGKGGVVEKHRWANGLTLLVHRDPRAPIFAYHTWLGVGSAHERPGRTGIAHLFEHLMFRESKGLPEGAFDRVMERCGAHANATTFVDWTCFHTRAPREHFETVCSLEAQRLTGVLVGDAQLEAERSVVLNERRLRVDDDPDGQMSEQLWVNLFGREHPYGWPTLGWEPDIQAIEIADCRAFHENWYVPANTTLVVVGDLEVEEVCALVERHYGPMKGERGAAPAVPEAPASGESHELSLDISSPRVSMAFPAPRLGDPALAAWEMLAEVLFGSESARLPQEMIHDREEALDVAGWVEALRHVGVLQVDLTLCPGISHERGRDAVVAALADVASHGIQPRERLKAAARMEALGVQQLLSAGGVAWVLGMHECTTGDFQDFFRHLDAVRKVEDAAVREAARTCLAHGGATVVGQAREEAS